MKKSGLCDTEWKKEIHKIRQYSPNYIERVYLYKKLTKNINGKVLDDGCGADFDKLALLPKNIDYIGIDYSKLVVTILKKKGYAAKQMDATNLKFKNNIFDYVLSFCVLEHIDDDYKYLQEAYRVLKPGGTLLLNVPLKPEHWSPLDIRLGHKRRYKNKQIIDLVEKTGFKIKNKFWGITFLNYLYRIYANKKSRGLKKQFFPKEDSIYISLLKKLRPFFMIDRLFNRIGSWGMNIYLVAEKVAKYE